MHKKRCEKCYKLKAQCECAKFPLWMYLVLAAVIALCLLWTVKLRSTPYITNVESLTLNQQNMLRQALRTLVATHPSTEVRIDMNAAVKLHPSRRENLMLSWQVDFGPDSSLALFSVVNIKGYGPRPVMSVDPNKLLQPRSAKMMQLVIFHEWQHYKQWRDKKAPPEAFYIRDHKSDSSDNPYFKNLAQFWYLNELEAYRAECDLAIQLGWQNELTICQVYASDPRGFPLLLADQLTDNQHLAKWRPLLREIAFRVQ